MCMMHISLILDPDVYRYDACVYDAYIYDPWPSLRWIYLWFFILTLTLTLMHVCMYPWCIYIYDPWSRCMCVWCRYEWCIYRSMILDPDACIFDAGLFRGDSRRWIDIQKKMQYIFPKQGGSNSVWRISKKSFDMLRRGITNLLVISRCNFEIH